MNLRLLRFLQGFRFQVNYPVLRYVAVCALALAGAAAGAFFSDGDVTWIILCGAAGYVVGRIALLVMYRE